MVLALSAILGLCLFYYVAYLIVHGVAFWRMPTTQKPLQEPQGGWPQVSILVPARNEAARIGPCLEALKGLAYPPKKLEIIVLDDASEDETRACVTQHLSDSPFPWRILSSPKAGKKAALSLGVAEAHGEIILTTDADSIVSENWVQAMVSAFHPNTQAVTGPVKMSFDNGLFQRFQALESAGLIALGAAATALGRPHLANGANLAYRREAFLAVGGYAGLEHIASGDDELLVQRFALAYPRSIRFCKDRRAIVQTPACTSLAELRQQRIRWVTKGKAYQDPVLKASLVLAYLGTLSLPVFTLFWVIGLMSGYVLVWAWLAKCGAEAFVLVGATRFFKTTKLLWLFLPEQVLYIFYVLWVGLAGTFARGYEWRGRRMK
jgi:poly-beta-1,6-N-acetyl-D-glucosamine synthase